MKVEDAVIVEPVGEFELKRIRRPLAAYSVVAPSGLKDFRINLDPQCAAYRELGQAVLKAFVRAQHDTARRQKGEPIETPPLPTLDTVQAPRTGPH